MNNEFASAIAMLRPSSFRYNSDTSATNHFQIESSQEDANILHRALMEFDNMVSDLRQNGVNVLVLEDTPMMILPDAVFPNNWFVSLPGEIILCPIYAPSRRGERRPELVEKIASFTKASTITDWAGMEKELLFLEGTGSLVFDRRNHIVFACNSERTSRELFNKFCRHAGYKGFLFDATDAKGREIYHTNVMMCLGSGFAIVCEDAIEDGERKKLKAAVEEMGRQLISINFLQMENFAGNMLQLKNKAGEYILVMSNSAYNSLLPGQLKTIESFTKILRVEVGTIEKTGGGSVRCMMAELF